jgi:hypothetical protein
MSDKSKRVLTFIGIILSVSGFYVGKAPSFPFVQRLIDSEYISENKAVATLRQNLVLTAQDEGFQSVAKIAEDWIAGMNPKIPRSSFVLERVEVVTSGISLEMSEAKPYTQIRLKFHDVQPVDTVLDKITSDIESRWQSRTLWLSAVLFWVGVAVSLAAQMLSPKKPTPPVPRPRC